MKKMNKLLSLVLVLALALSLAIPALAADPEYSITIQHPNELVPHTYEAYQIFAGTYDAGMDNLSNVTWGNGVNSANLLAALVADPAWASAGVTADTTASALAELLGANTTTTAMLISFRRAAGANLAEVAATQNTKDSSGNYVLALPAAGYYLVKDKDGTLDNTQETATNYILRVVGQDSLNPKGGFVEVEKYILDGTSEKEAADYSIGDTVHFVVTGTMPANLTAFSAVNTPFFYEFGDTMSKGLTFKEGSVKVSIENHGEAILWANPEDPADAYYTVATSDAGEGKTKLSITFADLLGAAKTANRTVDSSTVLILEYDAVLNAEAEIGQPGNLNEVDITFSNNPYSDHKGKTPEDYAWVFTWELDTSKTDVGGNGLAGAKFLFYRMDQGEAQYVVLDSKNKVSGWTKVESEATVIESPAGGLMPIIGLEADTYFLKETEAPAGYNLLAEPIEIKITATAKGVNTENSEAYDIDVFTVKYGLSETVDGNKDTGIVAGNVVNKQGSVLPETGGIGTTIFYILGATLTLGAVVLMITKKRMSV